MNAPRGRAVARAVALGTLLLLLAGCRTAPPPSTYGMEPRPEIMFTIRDEGFSLPERVALLSLQGVAARRGPRIWIEEDEGLAPTVRRELERSGMTFISVESVWELAGIFRDELSGIVVCDASDESLNVAMSLAALDPLLVVDAEALPRAASLGLDVARDVRGLDEQDLLERWGERFDREITAEFPPESLHGGRGVALAERALVWSGRDDALRAQVLGRPSPSQRLVYGEPPDATAWLRALGRRGAIGAPVSPCPNFAAAARLNVPIPAAPVRPASGDLAPGERVAAFVVQGGEDLGWLCGGFFTDAATWGAAARGEFDLSWTASPALMLAAPRALRRLYEDAARGPGAWEDFVAPAGFVAAAGEAGEFSGLKWERLTRRAGMRVLTLCVDDWASAEQAAEAAASLPLAPGMIVAGAERPEAFGGAAWNVRTKPALSYRFALREPGAASSPEAVAAAVSAMPRDPGNPAERFALIAVDPWSFRAAGGPLEAVRRTVEALPEDVRVVTAPELLRLLGEAQARGASAAPAPRAAP